jgi:hypothetical protein
MCIVKSIRFRGEITSSGIVNFDGKDAKWLLKKAKRDCIGQLSHDNAKVAKHAITQDAEGNLSAVLKISKDCIRQSIFKEDQPFHNPGIVHAQKLLLNLLSSAAGLLRGYMFADVGIKKKSAIYISDAVQTSLNVSTIDIGTQNSPKDKKVDGDDTAGLTMHFKESIGGLVTYEFEGAIDIRELQFISLSQVYDRLAVDPNYLDTYRECLKKTLDSEVSEKSFYVTNTTTNGLPEEGILLSPDQVKILIVEFFKRLIDLEIVRGACGRAWLSSLEIMPKENGLDNKNWVPVKSISDVSGAFDSTHTFYIAFNEEEALKLYEGIEVGKKKQGTIKAAKKESKGKKSTEETITQD